MFAVIDSFTGPQIRMTQNNGRRWESISGAGASRLPNIPVFTLLVDARGTPGKTKPAVYAGTLASVYKGVNDGGTWTWSLLDADLPRVQVLDLKMTGDTLIVGTYGRGVWRIPNLPAPAALALLNGPMSGSAVSIAAVSNTPLYQQVVANFTDLNNTTGDTSIYQSSIDWGEGTSSDGNVVQNQDGTFSVLGDQTYTNAGVHPVSVKIVDQVGQAVFVDSTAIVSGAITATAANLETDEPTPFTNAVVASFTDIDAHHGQRTHRHL